MRRSGDDKPRDGGPQSKHNDFPLLSTVKQTAFGDTPCIASPQCIDRCKANSLTPIKF